MPLQIDFYLRKLGTSIAPAPKNTFLPASKIFFIVVKEIGDRSSRYKKLT